MKGKKNVKVILPQGIIRKLILHFNIDKTIVMRDSLGYNNSDFMVNNIFKKLSNYFLSIDQANFIGINLGKARY